MLFGSRRPMRCRQEAVTRKATAAEKAAARVASQATRQDEAMARQQAAALARRQEAAAARTRRQQAALRASQSDLADKAYDLQERLAAAERKRQVMGPCLVADSILRLRCTPKIPGVSRCFQPAQRTDPWHML